MANDAAHRRKHEDESRNVPCMNCMAAKELTAQQGMLAMCNLQGYDGKNFPGEDLTSTARMSKV
jgi:hypothetical protein